jgi:hypothetical protein
LSVTILNVSSVLTEERENQMAERKSALNRAPDRPELNALLERAKTVRITEAMLQEQRASYVYGNAPHGSRITKESAAHAVSRVRVTNGDIEYWGGLMG